MLGFNIRYTFAQSGETVYINADGSVSPASAPINSLDNVTYVLVGDMSEGITVQRSNIVIDGDGHTLTPTPSTSYGFNLTNVDNVTITNGAIAGPDKYPPSPLGSAPATVGFLFVNTNDSQILNNNISGNSYGVSLTSCFGNNVSGNSGPSNDFGIALYNSSNNSLFNNHFNHGYVDGILLSSSDNNALTGNYVSGYAQIDILGNVYPFVSTTGGFELLSSDNNTLINNDVTGNGEGVSVQNSDNNTLIANNITGNFGFVGGAEIEPPIGFGILIDDSSNNTIYHNNFAGNAFSELDIYTGIFPNNVMSDGSPNVWDNGYPSGGNYWSDYNGADLYSGPYQNVTGSDGIGDTPYYSSLGLPAGGFKSDDPNNVDHYPLMGEFSDFPVAGGFDLQVVSNSTLSDFQFNGTALLFNLSAGNDNATFFRLSAPQALLDSNPTIFVNDTQVQYNKLPSLNSDLGYVYFTYGSSTLPEFPDPLILIIFMATLLAIAIYAKRHGAR